MKVLITGGAGYLGASLVAELALHPQIDSIVVYDNLSRGNYNLFLVPPSLPNKIDFRKADILDTHSLRESLEGIDIVLHLAARVTTPFADGDSHVFEQVNHWGSAELVYAIEQSSVSHLVYVSSTSVYGESPECATIETPPNPKTFYGLSKLRAERHALRLLRQGIKTHIIRCGNIFGFAPSMRFDSVINRFAFEANFFRKISIQGSGTQHRSFLSLDRATQTIAALLDSDLAPDVYNLVDETYSVLEIADTLRSLIPDLDILFTDQMIKQRELIVEKDERLGCVNQLPSRSLRDHLQELLAGFSFQPHYSSV